MQQSAQLHSSGAYQWILKGQVVEDQVISEILVVLSLDITVFDLQPSLLGI